MKDNFVAKHMQRTGAGRHEDKKGKKAKRERQKREWKRETRKYLGKDLHERELTPNFSLSIAQKTVLTKTLSAPTEKVAGEEISKNPKLVTARDMLTQYGLLDYDKSTGKAKVTDKGLEIMKEENLIDEMDELTPEGEKFAFPEEGTPEEETFETFSLLKQINEMSQEIT